MDLAIRHYLPGRVRLHVPELCRKPSLADAAVVWLRAQAGIKTARLNMACASLVVEYDAAREPFLQGVLAKLRRASLKDIAAVVAASNGSADEVSRSPASALQLPARQSDTKNSNVPPTKSEVPGLFSAESPLALPTLSLVMAFTTNPFVVALNIPLMLWNAVPIARRAWRVWSRERRLNVDFLDVLAITASVAGTTSVRARAGVRLMMMDWNGWPERWGPIVERVAGRRNDGCRRWDSNPHGLAPTAP